MFVVLGYWIFRSVIPFHFFSLLSSKLPALSQLCSVLLLPPVSCLTHLLCINPYLIQIVLILLLTSFFLLDLICHPFMVSWFGFIWVSISTSQKHHDRCSPNNGLLFCYFSIKIYGEKEATFLPPPNACWCIFSTGQNMYCKAFCWCLELGAIPSYA